MIDISNMGEGALKSNMSSERLKNNSRIGGEQAVIFQNCIIGIWTILKYYEPVLLQNTTYRLCYYLFIMEAEKFSVMRKRFISLLLKKQTVCNLFTSMTKEMIDSFL